MADRTDIDALLIGALYGELTPADEARLTAHLESHPADRTALADLTHTRAAVRDSRFLAFQIEPPQALSARLLQEASRRAPRPVPETAGWFRRFARSFMVHPAMAAAATLVLVGGVAGMLYVRGLDHAAEPRPLDLPAGKTVVASAPAPAGAMPATPGSSPEAVRADDPGAIGSTRSMGSGAGSAAYGVGLDEAGGQPAAGQGAVATEEVPRADRARDQEAQAPADPSAQLDQRQAAREPQKSQAFQEAKAKGGYKPAERHAAKDTEQPATMVDKPAEPARPARKSAGMELRTTRPQPQPKDLDDSVAERPTFAKRENAGDRDGGRASLSSDRAATAPGAAGPAGGASPAPAPPPAANASPPAAEPVATARPAPPSVAKPEDKKPEDKKSDAKITAKKAPAPQAPSTNRTVNPSPASPASPPPPPAATTGDSLNERDGRRLEKTPSTTTSNDARGAKTSDAKAARDKALLEWAHKQHDQVIAFVTADNCAAAASAAIEIYSRAPDYYATHVATDRSIKPCLVYVNRERTREDRRRAMKNATQVDTPAQAAPPARK